MPQAAKDEIKAVGYMKLVCEFAHAKGYFFFTVRDMLIARRLYEEYAAINN